MVNNVIRVVNYVIAAHPPLLNFMIADSQHRTVMLGMPRFLAPGPLASLPHRAARNGPEQPA